MSLDLRKDVQPEHCFWLADGTHLKNLQELAAALLKMEQEIFDHHHNTEKNDFYKWVKDIYQDKNLAEGLLHSKDKQEMSAAIIKRLTELEQPVPQEKIKARKTRARPKQKSVIGRPFPERRKLAIIPEKELGARSGLKKEEWIAQDRFKLAAFLGSLTLFILFIALGSGAGNSISGAAVGVEMGSEIQFLGLGGMLGAVFLLIILLKVHQEAKQRRW